MYDGHNGDSAAKYLVRAGLESPAMRTAAVANSDLSTAAHPRESLLPRMAPALLLPPCLQVQHLLPVFASLLQEQKASLGGEAAGALGGSCGRQASFCAAARRCCVVALADAEQCIELHLSCSRPA